MSDDSEGEAVKPVKLKLRPTIKLRRTRPLLIEENLKMVNTTCRKLAQEKYYGNAGQSPLTRATPVLQTNRQPVHQRLGNKKTVLMRMHNVSNNTVAPAKRMQLHLRRNYPVNGGTTVARTTLKKKYSIQQRLYKIRQPQNFQDVMQIPQNSRTKIIRHKRPGMQISEPTNFTVEVENPAFRSSNYSNFIHSVKGSLDIEIQEAVRVLQAENKYCPEIIPPHPIYVPNHGITSIRLHDRFSRLP